MCNSKRRRSFWCVSWPRLRRNQARKTILCVCSSMRRAPISSRMRPMISSASWIGILPRPGVSEPSRATRWRRIMNPQLKHAGIAGILTGLGLVMEFTFFVLGGYSADTFGNAVAAVASLQQHGDLFLRVAGIFGAGGAFISVIYVADLASKLRSKSPTRAVATLYFGVLGAVGHALVALSLYVGLPLLLTLAAQDSAATAQTWRAFQLVLSGFQAVGNTFLGSMLLVAGWAILSRKALPLGLGIVGILAGVATLLVILTGGTPLAILGYIAYIPTFVLAITFDVWAGVALLRSKGEPAVGTEAEVAIS